MIFDFSPAQLWAGNLLAGDNSWWPAEEVCFVKDFWSKPAALHFIPPVSCSVLACFILCLLVCMMHNVASLLEGKWSMGTSKYIKITIQSNLFGLTVWDWLSYFILTFDVFSSNDMQSVSVLVCLTQSIECTLFPPEEVFFVSSHTPCPSSGHIENYLPTLCQFRFVWVTFEVWANHLSSLFHRFSDYRHIDVFAAKPKWQNRWKFHLT